MKLDLNDLYHGRLEQIATDLKREYYKGHRKSKTTIALLLAEQEQIRKELGNGGKMDGRV